MKPFRLQKQTKIVATISDLKSNPKFIRDLYEKGMNVARLNTAHMPLNEARKVISDIREASEKIGIMIDTKGPEIRTVSPSEELTMSEGETVIVDGKKNTPSTQSHIHTSYIDIAKYAKEGGTILINDGAIILEVVDKNDDELICKIKNNGVLDGRKTVNIPDAHMPLPPLTAKDREFILMGIEEGIDFIAHSFVRNKDDLIEIQKILDEHNSTIKIISKIENKEGVKNIDEILEHTYGVMVARGDLGVEIAAEKIPRIQKELIEKCVHQLKPVIVATQMMKSMVNNPRPTRAEVNDVATAIYDGTDAVMLSEETALGKYPLETVEMMSKIAIESEVHGQNRGVSPGELSDNIANILSASAIMAARRLKVHSVLIDTKRGRTARTMAAFRTRRPIHCRCYDKQVMRHLSLSHGIHTDFMKPINSTDEFINYALQRLLDKSHVEEDELVVIVAGNFGYAEEPTFMEINTVKDLMKLSVHEVHKNN